MDAWIKQGVFDLDETIPQVNIDLSSGSTLKIEGGFRTKESQIEIKHLSSLTTATLIADNLTLLARHNSKIDISKLEVRNMDINMSHLSKVTIKTFHGTHLKGHLSNHAKLSIKGGKVKTKDISTTRRAQLDTDGLKVGEIT